MIVPERPQDGLEPLLRGLRRHRARAWAALWFEQAWPAAWPALGAAGLLLCLALLDVLPLLPGWLHAAVLAGFALAIPALLLRGIARARWPDAAAAERRLERDSGLAHRPLQALADRPALPGAAALWQAHLARTMARLGRLRVRAPRPGLAALDRRALRGALVVALAACLGIAGAQAPQRIARALSPRLAPAGAAPAVLLQAWITPPGYTGQAPVFLKPEGGAVTVPAGSHLTLSLSGGSGAPSLRLGGQALPARTLGPDSFQWDTDLAEGGTLALSRGGGTLGTWPLTVVADLPPEIGFPEPPGATRDRIPQVRLPWQVAHAYGVNRLEAQFRLRDRPDAPPLVVPIPLPSLATKAARGVRVHDLTPHPWAGLPVTVQLVGRSVSGKQGHSAAVPYTLPERSFLHPVARALMAIRRGLSVHPDARGTAVAELDRLAALDDVWAADIGGFLVLRDIAQLLRRDQHTPAVDEAQQRMWQLALHLEEGAPERTAKALAEAQQRLDQAMREERKGDLPPDRAEIDKRMRDLQEALRKHLEALAEQAQRNPDTRAYDPRQHDLDVRDMQRLTEEMRDAARRDRMDIARDKLAELEKMIEEMRNTSRERGQLTERERQRAQQRQQGQRQMSVLQDMVFREGALLDGAQGRAEAAVPQNPLRLGPALRDPGEPKPPDAAAQAAARTREQAVQRALRRALGELMQRYGDLMGEVPKELGDADTAMHAADGALAEGQDMAAAGHEQRAIEALQKGGQQMGQQMAERFGTGRPGEDGQGMDGQGQDGQQDGMAGNQDGQGDGMGDGQGNGPDGRSWSGRGRGWNGRTPMDRRADTRRDPLGRMLRDGNAGLDEGNDVKLPDEMEQARTRAIQEELRRRSADRERPQDELDYFDRLLRQF